MKHLKKLICASLVSSSMQASEKPTIVNETEKSQKLMIYYARYYEKDRPIKTEVTLAPGASTIVPWEKAYEEGASKIYELQKIEVYTGPYIAWELEIMEDHFAHSLISQGKAYIAIEPNIKTDVELKLALTEKGKKEYKTLSAKAKQNYKDLGIRVGPSAEEIKKHQSQVKQELQGSVPELPTPITGMISQYCVPGEE